MRIFIIKNTKNFHKPPFAEISKGPHIRRKLNYREGERISMSCMVEGFPRPILMWKKDGMSLRKMSRRVRVFGSQVKIYSAQKSDSGVYVCDARNKVKDYSIS